MINCIIVDDEYRGREVLASLIARHCPEVNIVATAEDVASAYSTILREKPDLVFLDIEMPDGTGFDLLQKFDAPKFHTVFVTSYDQYAIQAVRSHAFDYLLKPVLVDELKNTVQQLLVLHENRKPGDASEALLEINHKTKLQYIRRVDILWLKGDGNYTLIYTASGQTLHTSRILREYENTLCEDGSGFVRAHKSAIINLRHVKSFEHGGTQGLMLTNGTVVEVSRRKKMEVLKQLRSFQASTA